MKKIIGTMLVCLMLFSCHKKEKERLHIAVAANMQFAMKELVKVFANQTGIESELIISSSGKLTAQIKEGAPFDVFISADMKYPMELFHSGYAVEKPQTYAYGKLVLWSMSEELALSVEGLKNSAVRHVALANPKTAPYGVAAMEVLKNNKVEAEIREKLVYGESISQTNQFIISSSAEIGFTAKSVVLSPQMKNKGRWVDIQEADYSPIAQGVVVIKQQNGREQEAMRFYHFLFSAEAKKVLQNYGYAVK
ncbi:MAG: molybdate ABC transporter substrate-binding protein [Flavobacteriales bacterium]